MTSTKKMVNKLKFGFLAVLIAVPISAHCPTPEDGNLAGLTDSEYIKVYAMEGLFNDSFHIYVYGKAEKWEVKNPKGYNIPYNEISYMKLDNDRKVLDIRTEATK